jgi:Uma2 family endonuclease
MTTAASTRLSTAQFLTLPEDGPRYELEFGELIEVTRPKLDHNRLVHWLWRLLEDTVQP